MTGTSQGYMDYQEGNFEENFAENIIGQKFPGKFGLKYCEEHDRHYEVLCADCQEESQTTEELMDDDENFDLLDEIKKNG